MTDTSFAKFLNKTRETQGISREALRRGLLSKNEYGKIEIGERFPEKPMRDRLLARMGERGYEHENLLQPDEYVAWRKRDAILELIDNGEAKQAEMLLEEYAATIAAEDKVSRQFYFVMKLQLLDFGGDDLRKKAEYLEEAVFLTISRKDEKYLNNMVLSIEELNLLLEYNCFQKPVNEEELYQEIIAYVKQERFDEECRAMLMPKAAYFYCCYLMEKLVLCEGKAEKKRLLQRALTVSEEGIDNLRNNERSYFAWELLQKESEFLRIILQEDMLTAEEKRNYIERKNWNYAIYSVLDNLYEEMQIPKKTCAYTCFYREYEIYCINDVLRARRKMLSLKKGAFEELDINTGRTICTYRTVCRIESERSGVQRNIARLMLRKMNLDPSFWRARIATDNKSALRIEKQYRNALNQGEYEKAEKLLKQVRKLLPMELLINQQYIGQNESALDYYLGKITKEEYTQKLKQVLSMTVPLDAAMQPILTKRLHNGHIQKGEKYLSNTEIRILQTLSCLYGDKRDNPYPQVLLDYYHWYEQQGSVSYMISMREFTMAYIDSFYGNIGDYDTSDQIGAKILYDELRLRRLRRVAHFLYSHEWNDEQRRKMNLSVQYETLNRQDCLKKCILLTDFCKDMFLKHWFETKLLEF